MDKISTKTRKKNTKTVKRLKSQKNMCKIAHFGEI